MGILAQDRPTTRKTKLRSHFVVSVAQVSRRLLRCRQLLEVCQFAQLLDPGDDVCRLVPSSQDAPLLSGFRRCCELPKIIKSPSLVRNIQPTRPRWPNFETVTIPFTLPAGGLPTRGSYGLTKPNPFCARLQRQDFEPAILRLGISKTTRGKHHHSKADTWEVTTLYWIWMLT